MAVEVYPPNMVIVNNNHQHAGAMVNQAGQAVSQLQFPRTTRSLSKRIKTRTGGLKGSEKHQGPRTLW